MTKVRTLNQLVISVVKNDILLIYVGKRIPINMTSQRMQVIVTSAKNKDIKHIIVGLGLSEHQDLKFISMIAKSVVIELLSAG